MIYISSNPIRKSDISDMLRFKNALVGWDIENTHNHYVINKISSEFEKEELEKTLEELSYCFKVSKEIVIKVAGESNGEMCSYAYVTDKNSSTRYDTFAYCLSTRNGLRILRQ